MSIPRIKLNDGTSIPAVGFGTGTAFYQQSSLDGITGALKAGYRSIDCAQEYKNSEHVGEALKEWGGKREDLYILTKFGLPGDPSPEQTEPRVALKDELNKLGVDHVDMFLVHNPGYSFSDRKWEDVWKTLEALKKEGLTKSIGVSNFKPEHFEKLEKVWTTPPAVNQIRYHPGNYQENLATKQYCDKHNIHLMAFGPLTSLKSPGGSVDKVVHEIAEKKGVTPAQVLLRWAAQSGGGTVVTTSRDAKRREEMLAAFTEVSPLTEAEVKQISDAGQK